MRDSNANLRVSLSTAKSEVTAAKSEATAAKSEATAAAIENELLCEELSTFHLERLENAHVSAQVCAKLKADHNAALAKWASCERQSALQAVEATNQYQSQAANLCQCKGELENMTSLYNALVKASTARSKLSSEEVVKLEDRITELASKVNHFLNSTPSAERVSEDQPVARPIYMSRKSRELLKKTLRNTDGFTAFKSSHEDWGQASVWNKDQLIEATITLGVNLGPFVTSESGPVGRAAALPGKRASTSAVGAPAAGAAAGAGAGAGAGAV
jgi:hypothetical protein